MARINRRLHHRTRIRKLHPLAIVGICLGGAVLLALLIGNLLNLWLDDEKMGELTGAPLESEQPSAGELPPRSTQTVRAYPFTLGDSVEQLIPEDGQPPEAVSVSINTPDGTMLYRSPVAEYLCSKSDSDADLKSDMQELTFAVPYVCGVFYPQKFNTDDTDLLYAAAASDAALLREFVHAGGSEILIVGAAFDEESLPYLADYLKQLKALLGATPVGLAVPPEAAAGEDGWQLLPSIRPLADFLAMDLQDLPDSEMESGLQTANYYADQYEMRLIVSSDQSRWISAVEEVFSDYQIVTAPQKTQG